MERLIEAIASGIGNTVGFAAETGILFVAFALLWLAFGVLALVCVQILIGAVQYHTHLPWWLVLIHVATAASVWVGVVALAALFQRPLASLARA